MYVFHTGSVIAEELTNSVVAGPAMELMASDPPSSPCAQLKFFASMGQSEGRGQWGWVGRRGLKKVPDRVGPGSQYPSSAVTWDQTDETIPTEQRSPRITAACPGSSGRPESGESARRTKWAAPRRRQRAAAETGWVRVMQPNLELPSWLCRPIPVAWLV